MRHPDWTARFVMVSQFWTYKPEEFLRKPAYDRNHPPVRPQ
jgi:hypothetical protein